MPIPDKSILRAAIITNKKQVMQEMEEQNQQQAQQMEVQAQMEQQKQQSDMMQKYAKSRVDLAKEKELIASTEEKLARVGEIEMNAEHKAAQADMELVKMMIELEDMDHKNFKSAWELAEAIRMTNEQNAMGRQPMDMDAMGEGRV